jgi:aromatic-L-amino-acid/L-tryptophan decarboxylase
MIPRLEFKDYVDQINEWIQRYFEQLEELPVKSQVKPRSIYQQLPNHIPEEGEPIEAIMLDMDRIILPGITHWQHPHFHAYFPANSSVESVYAEMLTAAIGAQCMIWETSPAAAELEEKMMEWLAHAMGIPQTWEGVIQDTASSASLVAILTAREVKTNFLANENGVPPYLRVYCSTQTHSSVEKAVKIAGIGRQNLVKVPVDDKMAMRPDLLEEYIREDLNKGYVPCCVVTAVGTTGTVAIDPIAAVSDIAKRYDIWHHIDAAYAGSALLLPEYQFMIEGIEDADSFVFNPHKWLFTNFDCTAYYVKEPDILLRTFDILPEYLKTRTRGQVNDYRDWGIPLGRRFRALKLWFVLRSYGLEGIQAILRKHINLNRQFSEWVEKHPDLEMVTPPFLNVTCFRYRPPGLPSNVINAKNEAWLNTIQEDGRMYLTHTKVQGKYTLRMVFGQTYMEDRHLEEAIAVLEETMGLL